MTTRPGVGYLILMLTNQCNLSCRYCYLGGERLPQGDADVRQLSTADIDRALALMDPRGGHVQISGGEPLLVPELVAHTARRVRQMQGNVRLGLQTNGTCITPEVISVIRDAGIQVGISLDGEPMVQDVQRGRARETFAGLRQLDAAAIPFNVTCVMTRENTHLLHRLVLLLGSMSMARGLGLDLLVPKGNALNDALLPPDHGQIRLGVAKLMESLDWVNENRSHPIKIRELEKIRQNHIPGGGIADFCQAVRGASLAVTPDGSLFPCSQTAYDPDFYLGQLGDDMDRIMDAAKESNLCRIRLARSSGADCSRCILDGKCPGECPSRLYYSRYKAKPLACTFYQALADIEFSGKVPGSAL